MSFWKALLVTLEQPRESEREELPSPAVIFRIKWKAEGRRRKEAEWTRRKTMPEWNDGRI